jgi:hypothetical protein
VGEKSEVATFIRTLVGAGFAVTNTTTKPNYFVAHAKRFDEFGIESTYVFGYCTSGIPSEADCVTLKKLALETQSALVIACDSTAAAGIGGEVVSISKDDLLAKLGGPVTSLLPLEPEYEAQLRLLAKNQVPAGLHGKADDLFERYVHAGLQFLLRGRVLRYGQERRFEALPDGLILNSSAPLMLYDCKATDSVYEITKDTIRQFADYIREFRNRYSNYLEEPHAFVVVAPEFQRVSALQNRSNELYAQCRVPLVCLTAEALATCIKLFADRPLLRATIDWKTVFSPPMVEVSNLEKQVTARVNDRVIR